MAPEGVTMSLWVHVVRHGLGRADWAERSETHVVGIAALIINDQDGTPVQGSHRRRDFESKVTYHGPGSQDGRLDESLGPTVAAALQ
jgi:hypothetical protein